MAAADGTDLRLDIALRLADVAAEEMSRAREEIDALNVYPVPDGDTGTNMYLTLASARDAMREVAAEHDVAVACTAYARGALLGARGNSGVILSEMLGATLRTVIAAAVEEPLAAVVARGLQEAAQAAYAAVGTPVEGTMLTVWRVAAEAAAERAKDPAATLGQVMREAAQAARAALARTPEQLPRLRDAGVVDAGGRGVCVILDAAETVLTGRRRVSEQAPLSAHAIPIPQTGDLSEDGPAYEVMFLLDAPDTAIPSLRARLATLGDCLVVVGGQGLWNVHVHVDEVGPAIEAGIAAGRPHRIQVIHFAEQVARRADSARRAAGRVVIAVSAGPGLAQLFREAGAVVVEGGPGRRPSTGELLEAMRRCGAAEVILLPNDHDSVRAAEAAARTAEADADLRVAVIPTHAQVQGIAALAVHEPGRPFDRDVLEMTATARHARHGAVTVAAKRAMTMAGPCEVGDVLGVIDGDFIRVGDDLAEVAVDVLARLVGGGGELVTVVSGRDDAGGVLAEHCRAWLEQHHPTVDVVVYDGGQERYPLLVSVE